MTYFICLIVTDGLTVKTIVQSFSQKSQSVPLFIYNLISLHKYLVYVLCQSLMNIEKKNKSINICLMIICFYRDRGTSRIFVALFDYDPPTMSPNPEACDEELPFREGQLIKVCLYNYF